MSTVDCPTWGMHNEDGCHCTGFTHTYAAEDATADRPTLSLVEFLGARLRDLEQHAEKDLHLAARSSAGWEALHGVNMPGVLAIGDEWRVGPFVNDDDLTLIRRFHPPTVEKRARYVLADIAAKRRILALHGRTEGDFYGSDEPYDDAGWACTRCGTAYEYAAPWPCETLRALAAPFSSHPDFDPSWREHRQQERED